GLPARSLSVNETLGSLKQALVITSFLVRSLEVRKRKCSEKSQQDMRPENRGVRLVLPVVIRPQQLQSSAASASISLPRCSGLCCTKHQRQPKVAWVAQQLKLITSQCSHLDTKR